MNAKKAKTVDMSLVPIEVVNIVAEFLSAHSDRWAKAGAKERMEAIRDYIVQRLKAK